MSVRATLVGPDGARAAPLVRAAAIAALTVFAILFLWVESELRSRVCCWPPSPLVVVGGQARLARRACRRSFARHERLLNGGAVIGVLVDRGVFHATTSRC